MRLLTKLLTIFLSAFSLLFPLLSQDKSLEIGIGAGLTRGINESRHEDRQFGPLFGAYCLYTNGLGDRLTPELSFSYYTNGTVQTDGFSQYQTSHITPELRLRYYLNSSDLKFFIFAGLGAIIYNESKVPWNSDPSASTSGAALSIPVGAGLTWKLSNKLSLDLNAYLNMTTTDNLNTVHDNTADASWVARLGIHYTIAEYAKDSDGDGLSDYDEINIYHTDPYKWDTDGDGLSDGEEVLKYHTDPLNPDTDGGGISDGVEVKNGSNPLDPDDDIMSIPVGGKLIIRNIEFETAKSVITPKSEKILNATLKAMNIATSMELQIVGYTDDVGERESNIKLSKDRSAAVKTWLVSHGIAESRLTTDGMGPDNPVVPNTSDANRQRNRRVEFMRTK